MSATARPSALAPFRIRNYRFQWPSDLLTSWAFEVETLVLGWYILVETGSVLLLTADVLGRIVARPGEVQVGIITAIVGAPFLVHLVRTRKLGEL